MQSGYEIDRVEAGARKVTILRIFMKLAYLSI
jgi:hypothetical protein